MHTCAAPPTVTVLDSGWTLSHLGGGRAPFAIQELAARVPGCVHTDLMDAGLIADPFHGTNEHLTDWIGVSNFRYRCHFATPAQIPTEGDAQAHLGSGEMGDPQHGGHGRERCALRFEGIDTIAEITLNGTSLGRVRDMHRSYEFDVTDLLLPTDHAEQNVLDVVIHAPLTEARAAAGRMGERPQDGNAHPFNAIRKMACNFGWDWGPDLITSGIFRPVTLICWHTARLTDPLSVVASLTPGPAARVGTLRVRPFVDLAPAVTAADAGLAIEITLTDPDGQPVATTGRRLTGTDEITLEIPDPQLWWPVGEGGQPLYWVDIRLLAPDGTLLDSRRRSIGFRTVELINRVDDHGTSFTVRVNGRDLFLRGANWIPDDVFVSRISPGDIERGIADALDAHMNVLRIWGGGLFADDTMLARCDEAGLMIWQDFPFACAAYAEDAELADQVAAEAIENVIRMACHPALILWNGSNENVEGYVHWGWQDHLSPGQTWGLGYYTTLLPDVVATWDGTRPYTPTSPFNPTDLMDPRNPDHGSVHSWVVWNRIDYTHYRDSVPRFCAEFGFQGPAERATLAEYLDDDPMAADSPGMILHEKAADGLRKLDEGFAPHLPAPTDFEDWHFTTSLNQARAIETGISWFRSWWPRCAGSIIWQLNDCWPVSSWAAVDCVGRRKLLWFALRDLYDDHFLTIQPRGEEVGEQSAARVNRAGVPTVIASNLAGAPWQATLRVRRCRFDGQLLESFQTPVDADPRTNVTIELPARLTRSVDPTRELLVAELGGRRALWWFAEDLELALEPAALEIVSDDLSITVTAHQLVKDLCLLGGPGARQISQGPRRATLLPGESVTFHTYPVPRPRIDEGLGQPAPSVSRKDFRCVNDLLDAARRV